MTANLLFASQNQNKLIELQSALGDDYKILSLLDIGYNKELDEPFETFEENAKFKAYQGYQIFNLPCFSEDAGLVIDALNGAPGVWSARYAGDQKDVQANIRKVLLELGDTIHRKAYFIAVIAYYDGTQYQTFTGTIHGHILNEPQGVDGFGYDPVFRPEGFEQSLGELPLSVKNEISHRAAAVKQFIDWLKINVPSIS